jgi:nucleotidyltransferase substrate binding protein (TIGR01987 family)
MKLVMNNLQLRSQELHKALTSLSYMAHKPQDPDRSTIDSTIKRFEYTFEFFWKTLRLFLNEKGSNVFYAKDVLKEAYSARLIDNEEIWLSMLNDRNLTSHTYKEELADEMYKRIRNYVPVLENTFKHLNKHILSL